ncbi:MAG: hypothetical protein LBD14_02475 [Puniceicoccales bacterium]|jgi:hypothetical protein|nr:hypothetical protein [Puniceicoccales bacterium]
MKSNTATLLALLLLLPSLSATQPAAPSQAATPPPSVQPVEKPGGDVPPLTSLSREEVRTLIRIINLPPHKLATLRQSIEKLEKMPPEEKRALRKKLEEQLRNNPTGKIPPPTRVRDNPLSRYWRTLPPEKAREEQERFFQKMTREERHAYVTEITKKLPPRPAVPPAPPAPPGERGQAESPPIPPSAQHTGRTPTP